MFCTVNSKSNFLCDTGIQKDSHNSNVSLSKEPIKAKTIKRTRSLREKSDNPNGGQSMYEGATFEL